MARVKLTESQWIEIEGKLIAGEGSRRSIAREYGIAEGTIRNRFPNTHKKTVDEVINKVIGAQVALNNLPPITQHYAIRKIDSLLRTSAHLLCAGENSSYVSSKLSELARSYVDLVEKTEDPEEKAINIKNAIGLQQGVNAASVLPMGLINLSRDDMKEHERPEDEQTIIPIDPLDASKAYQRMIKG